MGASITITHSPSEVDIDTADHSSTIDEGGGFSLVSSFHRLEGERNGDSSFSHGGPDFRGRFIGGVSV